MALDDLLATLERQNGTSGAFVPPVPARLEHDGTRKAAPILAVPPVPPVPAQNRQRKVQAEAFAVWRIHQPDHLPAEVHCWPPATLAEVLASYPAAIKAEPIRQQEPARSCRLCRHLHRPGLSDGHCGGRDDLPHAYTAGHPLRRLPGDGGTSCTTWELVT